MNSENSERIYNLWIVIRPAEDVPGQWTAHCLDLDVVTQGNSLRHALDMIHEAALATILDDLNSKEDPLDRRAPSEYWDELWKQLMPRSERVDLPRLLDEMRPVEFVIAQMTLGVVPARLDVAALPTVFDTPIAFSETAAAHHY